MAVQYRVVGACAHATVDTPHGRRRQLLYKGAYVPGDAPEVAHLLSMGLIQQVTTGPEPAQAPAAARVATDDTDTVQPRLAAQEPTEQTDTTDADAQSDEDVEDARAEARAKLDAAGGKPTGRHGQPVWAEYLVTLGYDYDAVAKAPKEELQRLAEDAENR